MSTRSVLFACASLLACGAREPPRFHVDVEVTSDPGAPLAGVALELLGTRLAVTGSDGRARLTLHGEPGTVREVEARCPEGFRAPSAPVRVVLRPLVEAGRVPAYHVRCPPLLRNVVIAVRAQHGPHLPLRYLGKEIARTDDAGAAHALLVLPPGESATLTLDTDGPEHAALLPRSPELRLSVPAHDEVVVFDQTFVRERARRVKRRKSGPTRI